MCNCEVLVLWIRLFVHFVQRIETILLIFCFCPVIDQFWNEGFSWICCHFKQDIDFCNFNEIFGFQELENCNKTNLINCFFSSMQGF